MKAFLKTLTFLQHHLVAWFPFLVASFVIECLTVRILSTQVLREIKKGVISGQAPQFQDIFTNIPFDTDIKTWGFWLGYKTFARFLMCIVLVPLYLVSDTLWQYVGFVGFFSWVLFLALTVCLLAIESFFSHWCRNLIIDGYFTKKDSFSANWVHVKVQPRSVLEFCLVDGVLYLPTLFLFLIIVRTFGFFALQTFLSLPLFLLFSMLPHIVGNIAKAISYEENREAILFLSKKAELNLQDQ